MSDISISNDTVQAIALDNQLSGTEIMSGKANEIQTGLNSGGMDTIEQAVAGNEVSSRTEEYFGAGTDVSSTGTDVDIQTAVHNVLDAGIGSITDKIA